MKEKFLEWGKLHNDIIFGIMVALLIALAVGLWKFDRTTNSALFTVFMLVAIYALLPLRKDRSARA